VSANLDLVRSLSADGERGDLFRWLELADPEIEIVNVDGLIPVRSTGVRAAQQRLRDFMASWEDFHVEFEEYRELDGERVLVLNNRSGRGKTSGVELQGAKGAELLHIRDGRITKAVWYWDRDRALADLGLDA
jgi:ketosteroid isomerase-like protein